MKDAPGLLEIPKSECPDMWIRPPRHTWPKSWSDIEDPVVPLGRNFYGHPLVGLLWERQFVEVLMELARTLRNWIQTIFLHFQDRGMTNVLAKTLLRNHLLIWNSKYIQQNFLSLSNQCHRRIDLCTSEVLVLTPHV